MKNQLLTIALMLATVSMQAQKISHIETTKSWYYVYDDNGKKIKTISTSVTGDTFTTMKGAWIYTWSKEGKKLNTRAAQQ